MERNNQISKEVETMWKEVASYGIFWYDVKRMGDIVLTLEDGSRGGILELSIDEIGVITDNLRNEKPVYYKTESKDLCIGWEPVGEAED